MEKDCFACGKEAWSLKKIPRRQQRNGPCSSDDFAIGQFKGGIADGWERIVLEISGLDCADCAKKLEKLASLPGVQEVTSLVRQAILSGTIAVERLSGQWGSGL